MEIVGETSVFEQPSCPLRESRYSTTCAHCPRTVLCRLVRRTVLQMNPLASPNHAQAYNEFAERLPPWGGEVKLRDFAPGLGLTDQARQLAIGDRPDVWHSAFLGVLSRELFRVYVENVGIHPVNRWPGPDHWFTVIHLSRTHSLLVPNSLSNDWSVMARSPFTDPRVVQFNPDNYTGVTYQPRCCTAPYGVCEPDLCPRPCTTQYFDFAEGDGIRVICHCRDC